ncbi:MAG: hypothetical protein ACOX5G_10640 [Kiritimatiellia bacterium]
MKAAANKAIRRGLGFFPTTVMAFSLGTAALAAPIIDNNAGAWTDTYHDNLGVQDTSNTVVDCVSGSVRLDAGQTSGSYETVRIKPPGFSAWGRLKLSGVWSAPADVQVSVIDAATRATLLGPTPYTGAIPLAGIDHAAHPEVAVVVTLAEGMVSPMVSDLSITWTPCSHLLLDTSAPASVMAGQRIVYRLRYSVNCVEARNLVVWDKLPCEADGTMIYPDDYGQDDNVSFVEASQGGAYTAEPVTVYGVEIPGGSVYWDLGTKREGTTETLWFTVGTKNGTLNGTRAVNSASATADNAATVHSAAAETQIASQPAPKIKKHPGTGIYTLQNGHHTFPDALNYFIIEVRNERLGEGRETMYGTVVYDDLSSLMGKIDPDFGGPALPVANISPAGGFYSPAYTPPSGGATFPAVVWTNYPTLASGEKFVGHFAVKMLDDAALGADGSYTNTAWVDSQKTDPIQSSMEVAWPVEEIPYGIFAKGDNLDAKFQITALEDDRELFVRPGDSYPYGLVVNNAGIVALNDVIFVDRIPDGTTFKSAWFTDPWLQTNAVVFYSTVTTADTNTPPAYGAANVPGDIDVDANDYWSPEPPADLADVTWVAFYIPAVNAHYAEPGSDGWIDGAPRRFAVGYFDVTVSPTFLDPYPCFDKLIVNRGHFNVFAYTPLAGGDKVPKRVYATNDETTRVAIDKPRLEITAPGTVTPPVLGEPGQLAYSVSVTNAGTAMAEDLLLEMRWPSVNVNGVRQYLSFDSVSPASIREFDPENGRLVLELGNLAPGAGVTATLKATAPEGLAFGQQLTFSSTATAGSLCAPAPASDVASAVTRFAPRLKVFKNDVLDLIPSGSTVDYTLTVFNTGDAPSHGTFVVDRIPDEMVPVHATGPNGERVWFSAADSIPPSFLTAMTPIDAATIAANFTLGTQDGDVWTSPFGEQARWVAWEMDCAIGESKFYPVGCAHAVGLRLRNDRDGPGPGTAGSAEGTQIFNTAGVFSDELLQAVGNEVVTTIKVAPGIRVGKTGPDVVSKGDTFTWTVDYYNNSGMDDDVVTIEDMLPADVEFLSATHAWNALATTNGAPAGNSGLSVPSTVETLPDGRTRLAFHIASTNGGYRGANAKLLTEEGGTLTINVRAKADLPSNSELLNRATGTAEINDETTTSSDEHLVLVRNAEIRVRKVAAPELPVSGDTVTYNLVVGNVGQMAARDLVITDHLPEGVTFVTNSARVLTATYTIGQPAVSGGTLTWSTAGGNALTRTGLPPGELPARSGDVVIQYKGLVGSTVPSGTHLPNRVTVGTVTPEDGFEPNEDEASVDTPYPDAVILKNGPDIVQPGDRFDWTMTYYNATRQAGQNVYIIDTLPDADGDGVADVTFVEQRAKGPGAVTAYYHTSTNATAPAFNPADPLAGGWTAAPVVPVRHIAWVVGTLPGSAGPYTITVTVIAKPAAGTEPLAAGTALHNAVEIVVSGMDENPDNNTAGHTVRTPSNDVALTKTGSSEGKTPGLVPGDPIAYEIVVENTGTETAYGIEVADILPDGLQLAGGGAAATLALVDADGGPVLPVDANGNDIATAVPLTRTVTADGVVWYFGSTDAGGANYYRNVGILPGQRQVITLEAVVAPDVPSGARLFNTATVTLRNRNDAEPQEAYLGNNTDSSETVVYRPDVAVRKSVVDAATGDAGWTEAGGLLTYTIEYNNLGDTVAKDAVLSEIVPEGTTLVSVRNPAGSTVACYPAEGAEARSFDVHLGDLGPNPNKAAMMHYAAKDVVITTNNLGLLSAGDESFQSIAPIGDVNGDGIPDLIVSAYIHNDEENNQRSGGARVLLMDSDGSVKEIVQLTNGHSGIPPRTFQHMDEVGFCVAGLGDVNGDDVPDVILSQTKGDAGNSVAGAFIILLNTNGTAQSVIELHNGKNGVPLEFFGLKTSSNPSLWGGTDMDGDDIPDVFIGDCTYENQLVFYLLLLEENGTVKRAIDYRPGTNGIPLIPGGDLRQESEPVVIGDVDGNGVPDLFIGHESLTDSSGGGFVVLLETNLAAKSVVRLSNGQGGIPDGCFNSNAYVGDPVCPLGDFDGDGVPDVLLGASGLTDDNGSASGGAVILLLETNGTVKADGVIKLANIASGTSMISDTEMAYDITGFVRVAGDVDGDGVTDILLGGIYAIVDLDIGWLTGYYGTMRLLLLNPDGTVKAVTLMTNGKGGMPEPATPDGSVVSHSSAVAGDINGDGIPDYVSLTGFNLFNPEECFASLSTVMLGLVPMSEAEQEIAFGGPATIVRRLQAGDDIVAWDKLALVADLPAGASIACSIGRLVDGNPVYDLGPAFTDIPYPLPQSGLDISAIPAGNRDLFVKMAYTGTEPLTVDHLSLSYAASDTWPSFTFTVLVDDPVAACVLPDINNTVTISTSTPESDISNNTAEADIMVKTLDLEVAKTADAVAVVTNDLVTFTLAWRNNGPSPAVNAVLEDVLPAGLTFVSSEPPYDAATNNVYSWNLGDVAAGASGVVTVVARVEAGTEGRTLVNVARIGNDRQESDYTNNDDSVPVVVKPLANVWIRKSGPATVRLGGTAVHTLAYGNNGNAAAANVVIADTLPAGMTYVGAVPSAAMTSDNPKTWFIGTLAAGATGTVTVTVSVDNDFALCGTPLVNQAEITTDVGPR